MKAIFKNNEVLEKFLEKLLSDIKELGIDVSNLEMDHLGYQATSNRDYDNLVSQFEDIGTLVSEVVVGERRVGIFEFHEPVMFRNYTISAIELVAPNEGQNCPSAWEHVEFVINEDFESFMQKYPEVNWNTSAINQEGFPMIKLRLSEHTQVKFHLTNVLEIVKRRE